MSIQSVSKVERKINNKRKELKKNYGKKRIRNRIRKKGQNH